METERMERGQLRVYLGAAPGVGKTYAMLDEAHRRRERGTDVVVGYVETHGRAADRGALAGSRWCRAGRSTTGARARGDGSRRRAGARPEVVLVDELAHTNVPGQPRNAKRWQDVEALLAAGIDVITTVNIQHLESLNDVVEAITGVRQRETVPDDVVRPADQIELVDMSPQALRRRMAHGNVYAAGQGRRGAGAATSARATSPRCASWRCCGWPTGSTTASSATAASTRSTRTWPTRERVVVAVTGGRRVGHADAARAARIAPRGPAGSGWPCTSRGSDGLTGVSPDRAGPAERTGRGAGRHLPRRGRRRSGRGDPRLRPRRERHPGHHRRQPPQAGSRRLLRPGRRRAGRSPAPGDIDVHIVTHDYARGRREAGGPRRDAEPLAPAGRLRRRRLAAPPGRPRAGCSTEDMHGLPTEC